MTGRRGILKLTPHLIQQQLACAAVLTVYLIAGSYWNPAFSQALDAVSVDLSVLNDSGMRGSNAGPAYASGGKLLNPPLKKPVSQLHIVPSTAPKLVQPAAVMPTNASMKQKVAESPKKMVAPAAAPAPAPAPKKIVSAAPPPPAPMKEKKKKAAIVAVPQTASAPPPPKQPAPPASAATKAPPPAPKVAAAPQPTKVEKSVAAVDTSVEIKPGRATRIEFSNTATKIPDGIKNKLRALAEGVRDKSDLRLQLMAYAGSEGLSASKARRMSLSRALSVRSFLIENGVRSTRIDVRALGNKTSEKPANRVDVNIAKR